MDKNLFNNSLIEAIGQLPDSEDLLASLDRSFQLAQERLQSFASEPNFDTKMRLAFGENIDVSALGKAWAEGDFSVIPAIEIRLSAEINGANGAYAAATNKIYLAQEFLEQNASNPDAIAEVLLEEVGHAVDQVLNKSDSAGDEGDIFARWVGGETLTEEELQKLKAENDTVTISIDGQSIDIEQASTTFNLNFDTNTTGRSDTYIPHPLLPLRFYTPQTPIIQDSIELEIEGTINYSTVSNTGFLQSGQDEFGLPGQPPYGIGRFTIKGGVATSISYEYSGGVGDFTEEIRGYENFTTVFPGGIQPEFKLLDGNTLTTENEDGGGEKTFTDRYFNSFTFYDSASRLANIDNVKIEVDSVDSILDQSDFFVSTFNSDRSIEAIFAPQGSLGEVPLPALAQAAGYSHFNWINQIVSFPAEFDPYRARNFPGADFSTPISPPAFDPPPFGYTNTSGGREYDSLPYYHDVPGFSAGPIVDDIRNHMGIFSPLFGGLFVKNLLQQEALRFFDAPRTYQYLLQPDAPAIEFITQLVGVKENFTSWEPIPGFAFRWNSNWDGGSNGGIELATLSNEELTFDGNGGITIIDSQVELSEIPQTVLNLWASNGATADSLPVPVNLLPNAVDDSAISGFNTPVTINVLGNDTDPENDLLSIEFFDTTSTQGGTITLDNNGTPDDRTDDGLIYTPPIDFAGFDSFSYAVTDGVNVSTANVNVTVEAPPVTFATLSTPAGDGGLSITLDAFGAFGSAATGDAFYDPVGSIDQAGTTFESAVAIRVGDTGSRTFLSAVDIGGSGNLLNPDFTATDLTNAESDFSFLGLDFNLNQTVSETFQSGDRTGSILNQIYTITNPGTEPVSFELVRYLDGDLLFDGSLTDGGGRLISGNKEILFETDTAGEPDTSTTFVGITGEGGVVDLPGRFEIDFYSGLRSRLINGTALDDTITNDGADADEFVDAGLGFDITLALRNEFLLNPGQSTTYTTSTIFGTGAPEDVPVDTALNEIIGTPGRDALTGSEEDAKIIGLQGRDILTGGEGSDQFVYTSIVDAGDIITDFEVGTDLIIFTELFESLDYQGTDAIADGYVQFLSRGVDTFVQIDPDGLDGSGGSRTFILVEDVTVAELNNPDNFIF